MYSELKNIINNKLKNINNSKVLKLIYDTFFDTLENAIELSSNDIFIKTGDIDAMWLRDSVCQVMPYLEYTNINEINNIFKILLSKLFTLINKDPYSNSFKRNVNTRSEWTKDKSDYMSQIVWERKYELDSITYPFYLFAKYYEKTHESSIFTKTFYSAYDSFIHLIETELNHSSCSSYYFIRRGRHKEYACDFKNYKHTQLVYSAFRPSDDKCKYPFNIPQNIFLVSTLDKLKNIFIELKDNEKVNKLELLIATINTGINNFGIKDIKGFGKVYIYETDYNKFIYDDDANVPSLLSIPYLEYKYIDIDIYNNTRKLILSRKNRNYFEGNVIKGIGSIHTGKNKVWPMSLIIQGLTTSSKNEIKELLTMLINSTDSLMRESININNKNKCTREWFCWANALFSELALKNIDVLEDLYEN